MEKYNPKLDCQFQKPYVDIEEWREDEVDYYYVHGGFEGTEVRFSYYFPKKENYKGRFFQFMAPFQGHEDASQRLKGESSKIGFAISSGAYFVECNMGGPTASGPIIYQSNAAAAEYSREVAIRLFGEHRPYGYVYGGSGGGFKSISCMENTDTWDGAVPFIIGTPVAIPNVFTSRAHGLRVLRHKLPMIADALEPGGSGDIYEGLNQEEKEALEEVSHMGFPDRLWFSHEYVGLGALPIFVPTIGSMDPEYLTDFWTKPGYHGTEPNSSAVRDRIQFSTVITETSIQLDIISDIDDESTGADGAWQRQNRSIDISQAQPWIELESIPTGDLYLTGTEIHILSGDAAGFKLPLDKLEGNRAFIGEGFGIDNMVEILEKIQSGDEVKLENSDFIAIQTYHRHQIPSDDFYVWDYFKNDDGTPKYPQRPQLIGPMITAGGAGSLQSGNYNGKIIVVACLLDESAYPWSPDWYRNTVKEQLGEEESNNFRLWFMDNAMHDDQATTIDDLHLISYLGAVHQALLDVSNWVENDSTPHDNTNYHLEKGQLTVSPIAEERKGIQPIVKLLANGEESITVHVGEEVQFTALVDIPSEAGSITVAEWSFEGELDFPEKELTEEVKVEFSNIHTFSKPGTYFPVVRVKANRDGKIENIYTQIQNLSRVRVIVK